MDTMKVRSGLTPTTSNEVPYSITTAIAEDHLQKIFDTVCGAARKNVDPNIQNVEVRLETMKFSKKFTPFVLFLPTSVLKTSENNKDGEKELAIFSTNNGEPQIFLQDHIYKAIKPYLYEKKDIEGLQSSEMRRVLGTNTKAYFSMRNIRMPRIQKFNRGKSEYVIVAIDPIRIFHHMLESTEGKEIFEVWVDKVEPIKGTNYKYDVKKVYRNKNGKKKRRNDDEKIAYELQQRLVGGYGK